MMARTFFIPGHGAVVEDGEEGYFVPGYGALSENNAAAAAPTPASVYSMIHMMISQPQLRQTTVVASGFAGARDE